MKKKSEWSDWMEMRGGELILAKRRGRRSWDEMKRWIEGMTGSERVSLDQSYVMQWLAFANANDSRSVLPAKRHDFKLKSKSKHQGHECFICSLFGTILCFFFYCPLHYRLTRSIPALLFLLIFYCLTSRNNAKNKKVNLQSNNSIILSRGWWD